MSSLEQYDKWLTADDVAAIVVREQLVPVEGPDGALFPATYAAAEDKKVFPGGYNIDPPEGGQGSICLVDSVGSQANRIEPIFSKPEYAALVPQIVIIAGERTVNLLEAGHRAGDAIVRCTEVQKKVQDAFKSVLRGDAVPMAKVAPTSLVFGVWDSRDTQAKLPRLVSSTIRAFDVQKLTRGAQYNPPLNYAELSVFTDEEKAKAEGDTKSPLAKRGFVHVPATGSHGGVIAKGGVRRDLTFSLAALRLLSAGADSDLTIALRRYILGLSLVAVTAPPQTYLRQGCNLVGDPDNPRKTTVVHADGKRDDLVMTHDQALAYAKLAAQAFGVGVSRTVPFDTALAKKDVAGEGNTKPTRKSKAKASADTPTE